MKPGTPKYGFHRNKEIFSGQKSRSHLDSSLSPIQRSSGLFLQGTSGIRSIHTSIATFSYSESFQWPTRFRGMTPHGLSCFITCCPLLRYCPPCVLFLVYCSSWTVLTCEATVLISSLPSGLCPTISSERLSSASQYKDYPPTPRTLQPFYFFHNTYQSHSIFSRHFPPYPCECMLHKDKIWLTMPEQESPFENSRRLVNTPPLLFRWDPNYPTTFLVKMLLLNFCRNHSTSCYFPNWTISALDSFRREYFQWNKLWKPFWQTVRKHWQSDFQQGCVQVSQQVGLHMSFTITGATWFKLFRLGVWQWVRQAAGAKWLIIFSLLIAGSSLWFSHNGKNINPFESSPNFPFYPPRSMSSLLGKGTILLCYPYSPAIIRLLFSGFMKEFPSLHLCFNCPFINWAFFNPFPQTV